MVFTDVTQTGVSFVNVMFFANYISIIASATHRQLNFGLPALQPHVNLAKFIRNHWLFPGRDKV